MIRPVKFRMNEQTTVNNYYQKIIHDSNHEIINQKAKEEFDLLVKKLKDATINVLVIDDSEEFDTPDSIFPNNWISFHENSTVALYPMFAENRRLERKLSVLKSIENHGFKINHVKDYTGKELKSIFLEGTGSVVIDRCNMLAYCALSPRSNEDLFLQFCEDFDYSPIIFSAFQTVNKRRKRIYHTNVMMCIGDEFAIICLDSIDNANERKNVLRCLIESNKEVICISEQQVKNFAGNMIQLIGFNNKKYLVMSQSAYDSLLLSQIKKLQKYCIIISSSLNTIEACGGGSARCMIAEIFLPEAN